MLKYYKQLLLILVFIFIELTASATHIVGGTLNYEQNGNYYTIVLRLYRDCKSGSANFDNSVTVEIKDMNGNSISSVPDIEINSFTRSTPKPYIDTCAVKPVICIEEAIYRSDPVLLPPRAGGYYLYYQRCCRNSAISNLTKPLDQGMSLYTYIPDNYIWLHNSSPHWRNDPPIFVCAGRPINFDHRADDGTDADSLVYSFYAPYKGCGPVTSIGPNCSDFAPIFSGGSVNFTPIDWASTSYGPNNPLGGPNLTIDPHTGLLNGTPQNIGDFVVGIKCEEFRNGIKIGEIMRDYQFHVIPCPPLAAASFSTTPGCKGNTVSFTNTSNTTGGSGGTSTYYWNFGDPASPTNISTAQNPPPYSYPAYGTYTATLIINKGTPCVDSVKHTIVTTFVKSAFTSKDSLCISDSLKFSNQSTVAPNSAITAYQWNFGDASSGINNSSTIANPAHLFSYAGSSNTYTVSLVTTSGLGCKDTLKKAITVFGLPKVNANDTISCANTVALGLNGSSLNTLGVNWSVIPAPPGNIPGVFSPNANIITPTYTPTADEVAQGYATLVLSSTGKTKCPAQRDTMKIRFYSGPTANCGTDLIACKNTTPIPLNGIITVAYGGVWSAVNGTSGTITNPTSLSGALYTPSVNDLNNGVAYIKLLTTQNGNCVPADDTLKITFTNPPNITLTTANDTSCASTPFQVSGSSSTNAGVWTTAGDGIFANPNQSTTIYTPGLADAGKGFVYLHYASKNNGGCAEKKDSVKVVILSSPIANAGRDTVACNNNPKITLHGQVALSSGSIWSTTGSNPGVIGQANNLNTTYTPSAAELSQGYANVVLTGIGLITSCPVKSDTVKIKYLQGPTATINGVGDTIKVCKDTGAVSLQVTHTLSTGVKWTTAGNGTFNNSTATNSIYTPSVADVSAGHVTLHVQTTGNGFCFPSHDSLVIVFYGVPIVNASASKDSICKKVPIVITVNTATGSGYWTSAGNGTFMPSSTALSGTYLPGSQDGNPVSLVFHTTNNNGCKSQTDTIKVKVIDAPLSLFNNSVACQGAPVSFTDASTVNPGTVVSWQWSFGDGSSAVSGAAVSHVYSNPGTYSVTLHTTSSFGCKDSVVKPVSVYNKPIADFQPSLVCLKQPVQFQDMSVVTGSTITQWQWLFSNGHTSVIKNPIDSFTVANNSTGQLIVTSAQGCKDTIVKTIGILPQPQINFTADDFYPTAGQYVHFTDLTANSISWVWNFSDNSSDALIQNPSHAFNLAGIYPVSLTIVDNNGCIAKMTKEIIIALPPIVPNGFSPNGDGTNDSFNVLGGPFRKCHLRVYNNWGELIFESYEQKNGWDGRRDGVEQPLGVYVWVVDAETENGDIFKKSGDVTLMR